jgi:phage shock protein A
MFKKG